MGSMLETAEEAFREWRFKRSSCAEPIPENLWSMAIDLYPQYNRSKICKQLRLSGSQLKQRLDKGPAFADSGFVLASKNELKANSNLIPEVQLTIQGKKRVLTLCVDVHMLHQVLPHLGGLL